MKKKNSSASSAFTTEELGKLTRVIDSLYLTPMPLPPNPPIHPSAPRTLLHPPRREPKVTIRGMIREIAHNLHAQDRLFRHHTPEHIEKELNRLWKIKVLEMIELSSKYPELHLPDHHHRPFYKKSSSDHKVGKDGVLLVPKGPRQKIGSFPLGA